MNATAPDLFPDETAEMEIAAKARKSTAAERAREREQIAEAKRVLKAHAAIHALLWLEDGLPLRVRHVSRQRTAELTGAAADVRRFRAEVTRAFEAGRPLPSKAQESARLAPIFMDWRDPSEIYNT
jgi:hypothetical protein